MKNYKKMKSSNNLIDNRFQLANLYKPTDLADSLKPDIFFIVFDELSSSNGLKKHIGKENKALDSILRNKNFFVIENGKSNYNMTIYSVPTTLNMDYLPHNFTPRSDQTKYFFLCFESLMNNSLTKILNAENYTINHIQNLSFNYNFQNEQPYFNHFKKQHFFFKTLLGRLIRDLGWNFKFNKSRAESINNQFAAKDRLIKKQINALKEICNFRNKPKFIYAHLMIPHTLYIYDSIGHLKKENILLPQNEEEAYYQQLLYANKLINELVIFIQTKNKRNTIIIIEGDHGYHSETKENSNYYFENFNSFYFPDQDYTGLYDTITPINTFRIILNKYFSASLPLLKDSSIHVIQKK